MPVARLNLLILIIFRFRWAACQLDAIKKCRNIKQLRECLKSLPSSLDETYNRILEAIREEDSKYAITILRWLAFSTKPLTIEEVSEVIAIDIDRSPAFDKEEVLTDPHDILDICSSLVSIVEPGEEHKFEMQDSRKPKREPFDFNVTNTRPELVTIKYRNREAASSTKVVLAHYSVKEYLTSKRSQQGGAVRYSMRDIDCNDFIASSCLHYLLQLLPIGTEEDLQAYKLIDHSASQWVTYAERAGEKSDRWSLMAMNLFQSGSTGYRNWSQIYEFANLLSYWMVYDSIHIKDYMRDPFCCAATLGLTKLVNLLHESKVVAGSLYVKALNMAILHGLVQMVELLLSYGADPNASDITKPIVLAAAKGKNRIVEILIENGADVNAKDKMNRTALIEAILGGDDRMINLLLTNGADVTVEDCHRDLTLCIAVNRGYVQIKEQELILDNDVNIDKATRYKALYPASEQNLYSALYVKLNIFRKEITRTDIWKLLMKYDIGSNGYHSDHVRILHLARLHNDLMISFLFTFSVIFNRML